MLRTVKPPTRAELATLDAVATGLSPDRRAEDDRLKVIVDGQPMDITLHALRRTARERDRPAPRLRVDRVVLRVCDDLHAASLRLLPAESLAFVTLQAPIRQASKTVSSIETTLRALAAGKPTGRTRASASFGNRIRVGLLPAPRSARSRLVCLVYTAGVHSAGLLAMTRDLLALMQLPTRRSALGWLVVTTPERCHLLPVYRHILAQLGVRLPYRAVLMVFGDGKTGRLLG